ncbi:MULTISPECIES: ABC transporter ATP-binding protein [Oceanobacillus]|uniref:ABC transporter ATP-binding protein n=1 Tax=Oceanobacillus kimchii TaxID=746691 RepID=A0ABQ5TD38_9BACI|nr:MULTISPECIES: ABC transporter ATP-binding protein [Oceanobacillus]MBT2653123.1 ABC transporter ATP-binding protein [Oceanobacillus sp. ISL-73]MCT1577727.1 ABC transporter ATP-binding protein [Oceanobacillus kimchii]MCT2136715.1 ABC transporter ATP-binding protein [Oceanobacillus kimchii]GLO64551.1 ABC transporter ATP-binding protein [Oceanobacillus kimchii]
MSHSVNIEEKSSVVIKGLTKRFQSEVVLDNVDITISKNEIHGIIGRNGAGKTTFIECITGFLPFDSGEVKLLNLEGPQNQKQIMQHIGIQPQVGNLLPRQTVYETIQLFTSFYKESIPVEKLMDLLALNQLETKKIKDLSVGQKQRLLVGLALIGNPSLIILDEPTTGIDPQIRQLIWEVLKEVRDLGSTILLTTHYMEEAHKLCDRISILHNNRFLVTGTPEEIINAHKKHLSDSLEDVFLNLTGTDLRKEID